MTTTTSTGSIIKTIVKSITFLLLLPVTIIMLFLHGTLGTIFYSWLIVRFIVVYTFSVIRSAYLNKDVSNAYLSLIESLIHNYMQLYKHLARIPLAVWRTPGNIRFEIESILSREKQLITKNFELNVLILFLITASLVLWFFGIFDQFFNLF